MDFSNVVASYVYLDNMDEFAGMNKVYSQYFQGSFPARTTLQQYPPAERKADENERWPPMEQMAIIAVK